MSEKRSAFSTALMVPLILVPLLMFLRSTSFSAEPIIIDHNCVDAAQIPQQFLDDARGIDVFFNHQSVGYNILDGLSDLASQDPTRYACTIQLNPSTEWYDSNSGFGHFTLGQNFQPYTKVDAFSNQITTNGYGSHVGVAMMKFCQVDFYEEHGWWSDYTGEEVWNYYRPVMESLEAAYPDVTFVWWTCSLHNLYGNREHEEFNSRVRQYCSANNKILFDLAAIECHDPDGNLYLDGNGYPALYSGYTDDGGHWNEESRKRPANAWWWMMARLAGWDPNGGDNQPPTASPSASPSAGIAPLSVGFVGSGNDPDGTIVSYNWDFGDGNSTTEQSPTHVYNNAGEYTAMLTVTDNDGAQGSATVNISVTEEEESPSAHAGSDQVVFGQVALDGSQSEDPDGTIELYDWVLWHKEDSGYDRMAQGESAIVSDLEPGFYEVILTVTDNDGLTGTDTMLLAAAGPCASVDFDDDGFSVEMGDCNDSDPTINPGATEVCNGADDDCDGNTDEGCTTYYQDADGDGYGNPAVSQTATSPPTGYVASAGDCDDTNAAVHPGATELCNGVDDNCSGGVDEGCSVLYPDTDNDGYGNPSGPTTTVPQAGYVANAGDCNDSDPTINPGATEVCNGADDDCDGNTDEGCQTYYQDADGDGYGNPAVSQTAAAPPSGYVTNSDDCDDTDAAVHPGATELCNGVDDNCSGGVDEGCSILYADTDNDGYGDASGPTTTVPQAGYVANSGDCNDSDPTINPGATEVCNGADDDCDGNTDEGCTTYYQDADGDGYGNPAVSQTATSPPTGYVASAGDCDDTNAAVHPGATETCDGVDNDCDGEIDDACDVIVREDSNYSMDITLGDTLSFDHLWVMGVEPPEDGSGAYDCLYVVVLSGSDGQSIGQICTYRSSTGWQTAILDVPEELRGMETQINFTLKDFLPNTDPRVHLANVH